jgi:hypothetical protein
MPPVVLSPIRILKLSFARLTFCSNSKRKKEMRLYLCVNMSYDYLCTDRLSFLPTFHQFTISMQHRSAQRDTEILG